MAQSKQGPPDAKMAPTPPPSPEGLPTPLPAEPPTPSRASRRKSNSPKKLKLDDPEMPPLREVIPKNQALVSPPIVKTTPKGKFLWSII